jgi:hypothetical protein
MHRRTRSRAEPGVWVTKVQIDGSDFVIRADLTVPEGASTGGGRRGARLGIHGKRVAQSGSKRRSSITVP